MFELDLKFIPNIWIQLNIELDLPFQVRVLHLYKPLSLNVILWNDT